MSNIHYLDPNPGSKKAVLLLHGLGVDGSSWLLQFPVLSKAGFRPIAPDIPGFGSSPVDGREWRIEKVASLLACLLKELDLPAVYIVGISMGGVIAQQFALDYPLMTRKMVLVNTFSVLRPESLSGYAYFLWRFVLVHTLGLPAQARFAAGKIFTRPEQEQSRTLFIESVMRADPRAYRAAMRALGLFDSRKRLKQLRVPTLVITGANDTTVPPAHQRALVDLIPGAHQVIIEDGGHAVSVDSTERFNRELVKFLCEKPLAAG